MIVPLSPGTTVGPYTVTAQIGAGGMGEVYRARDTRLDRDVALKVLPEAFTADPDRLARFEREAKVLASLNHPNIGHIYGLEEAEGTKALVLELVEGPTLADRIAKGPIPLDEALPIAKQIAEALEAAHEAGVIHRDLKPANIKVREDGTVKVLDFGLAKALDTTPAGDPSRSPTLTAAPATQMGVIMGTAAYMSPEQARGKPVNKRTDVWAFGCVLYEMLTAKRAFPGDDVTDTLAAVVRAEPAWPLLPKTLSSSASVVLRRCLEKDRSRRVADIHDVRLAVEGAFETTSEPFPRSVVRRAWQHPLPLLFAGLVMFALGVATAWSVLRESTSVADVLRFAIAPPAYAPLETGTLTRDVAISPDGTRIVYSGTVDGTGEPQLYMRSLDRLDEVPVRGTLGGVGPFLSPDGQSIGFTNAAHTAIYRVPITGGPAIRLAESHGVIVGASWGHDGYVIFGSYQGGLSRVPAGGGSTEVLTTPDDTNEEFAHRWPFAIPGTDVVLFVNSPGEQMRLTALDVGTGELTDLGLRGESPRYVSTGHLIFGGVDVGLIRFRGRSLKGDYDVHDGDSNEWPATTPAV